MTVFNKNQEYIKKILLMFMLILFILMWLIADNWRIDTIWTQIILFIFAYGLGLFLMLGDEKYLQKIYADELEEKILITRSPLFILILPFLSIFILTSSGSVPGMALIMAINFVMLIEIWQLASQEKLFNQFFLQGIKKKLSLEEIQIVKIGFLIYFLFLLFLFR
jgi:hypothetical protein